MTTKWIIKIQHGFLLGLLEAKADELADILEDIHKDLEKYSTEVLNNHQREQILDLDDMITAWHNKKTCLEKHSSV